MAKRYKRRRKTKFKLKKNIIFNVIAIFLAGLAILIGLSYFQNGSVLDRLNNYITDNFGISGLFLPVILLSISSLFLKVKTRITKPNITIGLILSYICVLALLKSGFIGVQIFSNFADLISGVGAFIVLTGMLLIGLIVLFNTSVDDIFQFIDDSTRGFGKIKVPFGKSNELNIVNKKPDFTENMPSKNAFLVKKDEKKKDEHLSVTAVTAKKETPKPQLPAHSTEMIASTLVSNVTDPHNAVWEYPPLNLLSPSSGQKANRGDIKLNASTIEKTLESFGIRARVTEVNLGPAVTQYCMFITMGTKLSKITSLTNDLALALAAPTGQIRIEAPIPGRNLVGIEIPNRSLEFVTLRHMLSSDNMIKSKDKLLVALGLDVSGTPVTANIGRMPHVLIAGTTGSGKSVLINSWISSILFRTTPQEVRMIMVDPKRVELIGYNGIPHLLTPVIVEPDKILSALKWATGEMDRRYKTFAKVGVRNIDGFNEISGFQALPYIIIFIDELADLMAYAPVEVEENICRLAQMARATGIHLAIATQRPSVDVITGLIKANVPSRIAFNVSSMIDSRVIMDMPGAEKLLGKGDMLYIPPDQAKPTRIQGTYVSDNEVQKLVQFLKNKNTPVQYTEEVTSLQIPVRKQGGQTMSGTSGNSTGDDGKDTHFIDAVRMVCQYDRASSSLLQRKLSIGYARAARVIDQLEEAGIIGPGEGAKPREVLVHNAEEYLSTHNTPNEAQET